MSHLKAVYLVHTELRQIVEDQDLERAILNSQEDLNKFCEKFKMSDSCYRKRCAKDDEAFSILCELAIPNKDGVIVTFPDHK